MASLLKKVIKPWHSRKGSHLTAPEVPMCPPSPDLSHLTSEEISVINDVIKRQEEFERQESMRVEKLRNELESLQKKLIQRTNTAVRERKMIDLRLCRLCFKTKFADGVGRVCYDCQQRVCAQCGAFSKPRWNAKKNKNVRGRWRCKLCIARREVLCRTGGWYHPSLDPTQTIKKKLSLVLEPEAETDAGSSTCRSRTTGLEEYEFYPSGNRTDSELFNQARGGSIKVIKRGQMVSRRQNPRRRSLPSDNDGAAESSNGVNRARIDHDDDDYDDDDDIELDMMLERKLSRKKRQEKKQKRKLKNEASIDSLTGSLRVSGSVNSLHRHHNGNNNNSHNNVHSRMLNHSHSDTSSIKTRHQGVPRYVGGGLQKDSVTRPLWGHSNSLDTNLSDKRPPPIQEAKGTYSSSSFTETSSIFSSFRDSSLSDDCLVGTPSPPLHAALKIIRQDAVSLGSSCVSITSSVNDSRHGHRSHLGSSDLLSERSRDSLATASPMGHDRKAMPTRSPEGLTPKAQGEKSLAKWREAGFSDAALFVLNASSKAEPPYGVKVRGGFQERSKAGRATITWVAPEFKTRLAVGQEVLEWNGEKLRGQTYDHVISVVSHLQPQVVIIVNQPPDRLNDGATSEDSALLCSDRSQNQSPTVDPSNRGGKRRMLPKTPIEIKRSQRRVQGELQCKLHFQPSRCALAVTVVRARNVGLSNCIEPEPTNPFVVISLVPGNSYRDNMETETRAGTSDPEWEQTFQMSGITLTEMMSKSLQMTVWNYESNDDTFMGEVLLDLAEAQLDDQPVWYQLEEHDENSSRLPRRRRSHSASMSASLTSGSFKDSLIHSPAVSPEVPSHRHHRRSPSSIGSTNVSPVPFGSHSRVGSREFHLNSVSQPDSFTNKVRKKMRNTVSKMSSLSLIEKRDNAGSDESSHSEMPSKFYDKSEKTAGSLVTRSPGALKRKQLSNQSMDLLAPPQAQAPIRTNSSSSFFVSDDEDSQSRFSISSMASDRPPPDGDDVTSTLGPGQIPPKPSAETTVCGNIKLGFMVSKGQLEVDIICAVGLHTAGQSFSPDTYVKTYLVEGKKVIQRKKTLVVKCSSDPVYRKKLKYSACNVHGRIMKINIWEKGGSFEKKCCHGEVLVRLDGLDLSQHNLGWYKLFPLNCTDYGSDEFLNSW